MPVVDPTGAGYRFLSMQLALGLTHSTEAFGAAAVDRSAVLEAMVKAASDTLGGAPADCEVCLFDEDGGACTVTPPSLSTAPGT